MTRQEFDIFSERVRAKLLAVARSFGRFGRVDDEDAEDVVQEALTALWGLSDSGYPVRDAEALAVKWMAALEYWAETLGNAELPEQMAIFRNREEVEGLCRAILSSTPTKLTAA